MERINWTREVMDLKEGEGTSVDPSDCLLAVDKDTSCTTQDQHQTLQSQ